ncbi:hypothetical protein B0T18DRAFT_385133 [Schizothecium vesticola]|uniref:Uncharacterized protein n=1 Tax=Schizothecium vesticola TaxID=314040 RepID=A0AA40F8E8_9PEZI|nr:hypothetical protein B0T18DRAFT_385133 [Schizothecium vesticola]
MAASQPGDTVSQMFSLGTRGDCGSFRGDPGSIELNELLHHAVTELLGVSPEAAEALKKLGGIESVLDLATSIVFDAARKIVSAAMDPASPVFRCGKVSKDLVRDAFGGDAKPAYQAPDLALNPPYPTSHGVMNFVYFPETSMSYDPERHADLIPKTHSGGFKTVTVGALLAFTQSCVTLAPGESMRVAVIDWSRRSSAGEKETITEADRLSSNLGPLRAISEVTSAVTNESQCGV